MSCSYEGILEWLKENEGYTVFVSTEYKGITIAQWQKFKKYKFGCNKVEGIISSPTNELTISPFEIEKIRFDERSKGYVITYKGGVSIRMNIVA